MAKIKLTKNELKKQRDDLARFQRFLPTLLLKKQQLQAEVRTMRLAIAEKAAEEQTLRDNARDWLGLFTESNGFDFEPYISIREIFTGEQNIVGVNIPVFEGVEFEDQWPDPFATPAWVDEGVRLLRALIRLRIERDILHRQEDLLEDELRTTSQRVNLFEKVKIPQCLDAIRVIQIFLGDQQTAAVARAKLAKGKTQAQESLV